MVESTSSKIAEGQYQQCRRCVMDTDDINISFDAQGYCNHCNYFYEHVEHRLHNGTEGQQKLATLIEKAKASGKGKKYDVIMGLSGGADSSYVAYLAKNFGLRILAVHLDNGWNSELAVHNIERCIEWAGADLYTHVIDWEEFKSMQLAYLKASVIDIEALTDHAIRATIFKLANKYNIKYYLSGQNLATESIMPSSYGYSKVDLKNIKAINRRFGTQRIKTFPSIPLLKLIYYKLFVNIKAIPVLNYVDYDRDIAIKEMEEKMDWKYYGGKHYESTFTKFYQGYVLPKKFGIDKRKPHLSSMICSGQISREEALALLEQPIYPPDQVDQDKEYVAKKFNLSVAEFDAIMEKAPVSHLAYPNNNALINYLLSFTSAKQFVEARKGDKQ